jgi:hypothetical protein
VVSSKYLDVASDGSVGTIRCRFCKAEIYRAPIFPSLNAELLEEAMLHLEEEHQVTRPALSEDCQRAFLSGVAEKRKS